MHITFDNFKGVESKQGIRYVSFWVRLLWPGENGDLEYLSIAGWKYFPETGVLGSPSQMTGKNKFMNLTKLSTGLYNQITKKLHKEFNFQPSEK